MTTVVLGWDGLDAELVERYGPTDAFGAAGHRIDTLTNDYFGKPHTWELWPTIITGLPPDGHGIHAEEFVTGDGFSSRFLNLAARLSDGVVPHAWRLAVGRFIRAHGASFDYERLAYYDDNDLPTVFDGVDGRAIAIPNARSPFDDAVGTAPDRGARLSDYLDAVGESGVRRPTVPLDVLRARVEAECTRKLGLVLASLDCDLVFVWLAYLDTLGHVAPTVADSEAFMRDAYDRAATYTQFVADQLDADDTLICVSDHGLRQGEHTTAAYVASTPAHVVADVAGVCDVAGAVQSVTSQTNGTATRTAAADEDAVDSVRDRLDALGYLDD